MKVEFYEIGIERLYHAMNSTHNFVSGDKVEINEIIFTVNHVLKIVSDDDEYLKVYVVRNAFYGMLNE
jgi:hypothetical protein